MPSLTTALLAVAALFGALFLWGLLRLRRGSRQSAAAIRRLRVAEIAALVAEGHAGLARGYALTLDLADRTAAAEHLDRVCRDRMKLKNTFARDGFYWRFALPLGALVGEHLRLHARGEWRDSPEGPVLALPLADGTATCHPFAQVLQHVRRGAPGDLAAYLTTTTLVASRSHPPFPPAAGRE